MPANPQTPEGGSPGTSQQGAPSFGVTQHNVFVVLAGELTGIAVLAVAADMSDGLGKLMVALVGAWFFVFLLVHVSTFQDIFAKVSSG